jgi:hypothetical protein
MVVVHELSDCTTCLHICFSDSDSAELLLLEESFAWAHRKFQETRKDTFIDITINYGGGDLSIANSMARLIAKEKDSNLFQVTVAAANLASAGIYYMRLLDNPAFCYGSHATTVGNSDTVADHSYVDYDLDMFNVDQNVSSTEHQWVQVATSVDEYYNNRVNGAIDTKAYLLDLHVLFVSMPPSRYTEELAAFSELEVGTGVWYDKLLDLVYTNWCNLVFHKQDRPLPTNVVREIRQHWSNPDSDDIFAVLYVPKWLARRTASGLWLPSVDAWDLFCSLAAYVVNNGDRFEL